MATSGKTRMILSSTLWLASLGAAYVLGGLRHSPGSFPGGSGDLDRRSAGSTGGGLMGASGTSSPNSSSPSNAGLSASGRSGAPGGVPNPGAGKYESRLTSLRSGKSTPDSQSAIKDLIAEWSERDPAAALAAVEAEPALKLRADLRATALLHWAKTDPEKAWAFARENAGGELPDNRFDLVLDGIGRGDPQTALKFLQDHGEDMGRRLARAGSILDDLYERGNQEAIMAWAEALPAGKVKEAAQTRLIDRWARYDPEAAMSWMNAQVKDPKTLATARAGLAESWAQVSPDAALKWVDSLPADQRGRELYSRIYGRWIDYDRNAAGAALAAQPASPSLDRPIERYTYEVMKENPADTMPWAESIGDKDRRWRAVERVAEEWRRRDPEGLQNYLAGSDFNENQKRKLLGLPKPGKGSGIPAVPGAR